MDYNAMFPESLQKMLKFQKQLEVLHIPQPLGEFLQRQREIESIMNYGQFLRPSGSGLLLSPPTFVTAADRLSRSLGCTQFLIESIYSSAFKSTALPTFGLPFRSSTLLSSSVALEDSPFRTTYTMCPDFDYPDSWDDDLDFNNYSEEKITPHKLQKIFSTFRQFIASIPAPIERKFCEPIRNVLIEIRFCETARKLSVLAKLTVLRHINAIVKSIFRSILSCEIYQKYQMDSIFEEITLILAIGSLFQEIFPKFKEVSDSQKSGKE